MDNLPAPRALRRWASRPRRANSRFPSPVLLNGKKNASTFCCYHELRTITSNSGIGPVISAAWLTDVSTSSLRPPPWSVKVQVRCLRSESECDEASLDHTCIRCMRDKEQVGPCLYLLQVDLLEYPFRHHNSCSSVSGTCSAHHYCPLVRHAR